jgi:hypothetical protein
MGDLPPHSCPPGRNVEEAGKQFVKIQHAPQLRRAGHDLWTPSSAHATDLRLRHAPPIGMCRLAALSHSQRLREQQETAQDQDRQHAKNRNQHGDPRPMLSSPDPAINPQQRHAEETGDSGPGFRANSNDSGSSVRASKAPAADLAIASGQ